MNPHSNTPETPGDSEHSAVELSLPEAEEVASLRQAAAEALEYKDKYLRNLAEMENSKKRLQKERSDLIRYANENLILDLLSPLDSLETALQFAEGGSSPEVRHWAQGFQMILGQLLEALHRHGVESFTSVGQLLDPEKHEAVEVLESTTVPEGTILKEFTKGYRMGDRVIRAARVQVSKTSNP